MRDCMLTALCFYADWLHKPFAQLLPIAGLYIHMLAPEALRAVVCVAVALHLCAALLAGEVFSCASESHYF